MACGRPRICWENHAPLGDSDSRLSLADAGEDESNVACTVLARRLDNGDVC